MVDVIESIKKLKSKKTKLEMREKSLKEDLTCKLDDLEPAAWQYTSKYLDQSQSRIDTYEATFGTLEVTLRLCDLCNEAYDKDSSRIKPDAIPISKNVGHYSVTFWKQEKKKKRHMIHSYSGIDAMMICGLVNTKVQNYIKIQEKLHAELKEEFANLKMVENSIAVLRSINDEVGWFYHTVGKK